MGKEESAMQKSRSFHFRKMFDLSSNRQTSSLVQEMGNGREAIDEILRNEGSALLMAHQIGSLLDNISAEAPSVTPKKDKPVRDVDLMKEKFAKLLLGEDMSGGGKGVSSALALSNAITNHAASVFGEQEKLEPMSADRKARWKKETDWLLSVTDYIVELVPSRQKAKDGSTMEIMVTQQRRDLLINIPALRKLDVMLLGTLDNFSNEQEFKYVSKHADDSEKGIQRNDKWWLPTVKVPQNGLSEESRQFLQKQKEAVNQVLKASMAINAQILSDMDIPDDYIESLPKNGRSSLGDSIYRSITVDSFDPLQFLSTMDLSTEHKVVDLKNRIEASIVIWKRKMNHKDGKSSWSSGVSLEKRELFEERAETILLLLKQQFPGIPQSSLEISKIQFNRDVGLAVQESYSRVLETLANTVMSRIQDVLYADSLAQDPSIAMPNRSPTSGNFTVPGEEPEKLNSCTNTPTSMTLSDFMGWNLEPADTEAKRSQSAAHLESEGNAEDERFISKLANINIKKLSYLHKIDLGGDKSPAVAIKTRKKKTLTGVETTEERTP